MAYTKASHKEQCVPVIVPIPDQWDDIISKIWATYGVLVFDSHWYVHYSLDAEWLLISCVVCLTQVNREQMAYKGRLASVSSSQSNASSGFSEENGEISEEDSGDVI